MVTGVKRRSASPGRTTSASSTPQQRRKPVPEQRPLRLAAVLFVLSMQAVTLLLALEHLPSLKSSPILVASVGVLSLAGISIGAKHAFMTCGCTFSPSAIFFAVTGWSAAIDLVLALALRGATTLGKFYVETGEEYFKSSWGYFALLWDGTAHYALQLTLAHATLLGRPCRVAGLVWAGSIINSMPVLLLGGASGVFSSHIKPSTALNAPYVLVPIAYLASILEDGRELGSAKRGVAAKDGVNGRWGDTTAVEKYFWAAFHFGAICVHALRAAVVLGSQAPLALWWGVHVDPILLMTSRASHGFVRVQCLVFFFYYVPYHAWALYDLLLVSTTNSDATTTASRAKGVRKSRRATWATIFAGGYLQAQVTFIGAAALRWVGFQPLVSEPPSEPPPCKDWLGSCQALASATQLMPHAGWALGVALIVLPAAWAVRCLRD